MKSCAFHGSSVNDLLQSAETHVQSPLFNKKKQIDLSAPLRGCWLREPEVNERLAFGCFDRYLKVCVQLQDMDETVARRIFHVQSAGPKR